MNILFVDDEPALCLLGSQWLKSLGHEARCVCSSTEALYELNRDRYDLLLTDIVMPGHLDGIALANTAQKQWPGLKIILMSGYAKGFSRDALRFPLLQKPYRKHDLKAALDMTCMP